MKHPAAPGIPEFIRTLAKLMNMDFRWIRQRGIYIATAHNGRGAQSMDHHFECDPKVMTDDTLWMEWMKLVADHLAGNGVDTASVKTKMKDYVDIYTGEILNEQDPTVGSTDDGRGPDGATGTGRDSSDSGELQSNGSPPPIAADWPGTPERNGPGPAAADDHAD